MAQALRRNHPDVVPAREELADDILYRQYVQWVAQEQWKAARKRARRRALRRSAVHGERRQRRCLDAQDQFRLDASVGVPAMRSMKPARTGACRSIAGTWSPRASSTGCGRARRRNAALFDGYRVDHPGRLLSHLFPAP